MIMQQPGMIDDRLQDERLAAGDGGAMAAVHRARGELRACGDIGLPAPTANAPGEPRAARAPAQRSGRFETRPCIRGRS